MSLFQPGGGPVISGGRHSDPRSVGEIAVIGVILAAGDIISESMAI